MFIFSFISDNAQLYNKIQVCPYIYFSKEGSCGKVYSFNKISLLWKIVWKFFQCLSFHNLTQFLIHCSVCCIYVCHIFFFAPNTFVFSICFGKISQIPYHSIFVVRGTQIFCDTQILMSIFYSLTHLFSYKQWSTLE